MNDKNAEMRLKTCEFLVKMIKNKEISAIIVTEFTKFRVDENSDEKYYGILLDLIDIAQKDVFENRKKAVMTLCTLS